MAKGFPYEICPFHPGDVIYTGTCEGVGPMDTGDTVEVEISHSCRRSVAPSTSAPFLTWV